MKYSLIVTAEGKPSSLISSAAGQVAQLKSSAPTQCTQKVLSLLLCYVIFLSVTSILEVSVPCSIHLMA